MVGMKERPFRRWLDGHCRQLMVEIGVSAGQTVLDYGCGKGTCTIDAARLVGPTGKVFALDVQDKALQRIADQARREDLANIETLATDGAPRTGLPDGSVDVVLLYDVLQKIDDWAPLFAELARVLRIDGLLSVFPMHIGKDKLVRAVDQFGGFVLTGELYGHVYNFRRADE